MKKLAAFCLAVAAFLPATLYAGGIVTNTNQSASFIRMPAQDATISIEGVYFNPAGLVHLDNGFYVSLSSQTVSQTREISSTFDMNKTEFQGDVFAPVFPTFYAVYKKDKVAYSLGVNPIGGGGSANFENGLPSFEQMVAELPLSLTAGGIATDEYSMKSSFNGSSLNWGIQFNASYALNDMISLSLGFRYVIANNTYEGYLKDVMINPLHPLNPEGAGNMVSAPLFFSTLSTAATSTANQLQEDLIDNGAGGFTLDQLVAGSQITQAQADAIAGGLGDAYNSEMTVTQIQGAYFATADAMAANAAATSDMEVDASQSSFGISPIIGVNLKFSDNLNVALKYEHKTEMTLTNKTVIDNTGLYPDGAKTPNDMPSLLTVGVGYRPTEKLFVTGGVHYYFDKNANYGKKINGEFVDNEEVLDANSWEAALGLEYAINDNIIASIGYLRTQSGANDKFHTDLGHSLNTNSVGLGGKYLLSEKLGINLGFMYTAYEGYTKDFTGYEETYNRKAMVAAIGFDYKF